MKKILFATLLCFGVLAACQRPEKQAESVAESFLKDYYAADYAAAATQCTPRFAALVEQGADDQETLPADLAQKIKEAVDQTSFKIISIELDEDAASARVTYDVYVPGLEKPVRKALRLQLEGGTALVDGIE